MTQHVAKQIILWLGFSIALGACNGAGFGGAEKQKNDKDKKGQSADTEKDDGDASAPVSVAGAFLIQREDKSQSTDTKKVIGVAVYDANSQRMADPDMVFTVKINDKPTNVIPAGSGSNLSFYYMADSSDVSDGESEVVVKRGNGDLILTETRKLSDILSASNDIPAYGFVLNDNLKSLLENYGYDPSATCRNQKPIDTYQPSSSDTKTSGQIGQDLGVMDAMKGKPVAPYDPSSGPAPASLKCYVKLKKWKGVVNSLFPGTTEYMNGYEKAYGCYSFYVRTTSGQFYVMVTSELQIKHPENIDAIVKSQLCPN